MSTSDHYSNAQDGHIPTTFMDLPGEIHCQIAKQLFYQQEDIIPYIITCKLLYSYLHPLLFQVKVVALNETIKRFAKVDQAVTNRLDEVLVAKPHYAHGVRVLRLGSSRSINKLASHRGLYTIIPQLFPMCHNLQYLFFISNSIPLLFHCLTNLPPNLIKLHILLTAKRRHWKATKLQLLDPKSRTDKSKLKSIIFKSPLVSIMEKVQHPENGNWDWSSSTAFETSLDSLNQTSQKNKTYRWVKHKDKLKHRAQISLKIGELLYNLLQMARESIVSMKLRNFDVATIFHHNFQPLKYPKFEHLDFDAVSMYRVHRWFPQLTAVNESRFDTGDARPLTFMISDKLGGSVYVKQLRTRLDHDPEIIGSSGFIDSWILLDIELRFLHEMMWKDLKTRYDDQDERLW